LRAGGVVKVLLGIWAGLALSTSLAVSREASSDLPLSPEAINGADLTTIAAQYTPSSEDAGQSSVPDPAIVKLQILLDRTGASPGVIDGFDGENVRKAVIAFEEMNGLPTDGLLDPDLLALLDRAPVVGSYLISVDDRNDITGPVPEDYALKAHMDFLGYATMAEKLAERFHMDVDLLTELNPEATYQEGEQIIVAGPGLPQTGTAVSRIEADKSLRQVRAYDAAGNLIVAYPATIGSEDNPSPSGTHTVEGVAPMPEYTYNPSVNFQQGDNTEVLAIPPGPNGPVGSMWIDLSEPTYGIHGTPEPSLIDKTGSHGCVRLTNWDAEELGALVSPGVVVEFLE
jgi:lipoprotein-anchoring transpeptidase ErfK/SrfK